MTVNVSKTFEFNPSLGEIILSAFGRVGVRGSELTANHLYIARQAANFLLSEWSNQAPNLWEVDLIEVPLLESEPTYTVPAETVMILDSVISTGSNPSIDRMISPSVALSICPIPIKSRRARHLSFGSIG